MGRWTATALHLAVWLVGGVLYFLFVLPRWWELMGQTSHTLGTVLRIVTGLLFALAALPVLLTLQRTRKPALGTPALALRLRFWSLILHLSAGVLIIGAAVAEIWLSLDSAGPWLFGVYGAAAAVAILALGAFYLAFVADQAPKPPKPPKEKKAKRKRGKAADEAESDADEAEAESEDDAEVESTEEPAESAEEPASPAEPETTDDETPAEVTAAAEPETEAEPEAEPESQPEPEPEAEAGALRNKRPTGKTRHRLRRSSRGTVALDE
ncbi:hypothetical protein [Mycobacterium sp. M26]|uniref:hypothetical protein n=1 Tax=Mycobacterium sp. M26 TaxID=1762962 RepID=UPI00073F32A1|nr:hypothetical protein [Mycobacterium sp. M26]